MKRFTLYGYNPKADQHRQGREEQRQMVDDIVRNMRSTLTHNARTNRVRLTADGWKEYK